MEQTTFISKDGVKIFMHPTESHPHRTDLVEETIGKLEVAGRPFVVETMDLGRVIGVDHLISTTDEDDSNIFFAERREGMNYKSRMVRNRKPTPTTLVTVIVAKCDENDGPEWAGKYVLITLYEGDPGKPEPYGKYENDQECIDFWKTHALVPEEEQ